MSSLGQLALGADFILCLGILVAVVFNGASSIGSLYVEAADRAQPSGSMLGSFVQMLYNARNKRLTKSRVAERLLSWSLPINGGLLEIVGFLWHIVILRKRDAEGENLSPGSTLPKARCDRAPCIRRARRVVHKATNWSS